MTEDDLIHYRNKVYYSQNREDLILESFFDPAETGFYVDIGAYDPDYDSVTKKFYNKGWHGINVEPQRRQYERFVKRRRRDINIQAGVSDKAGSLELTSYASGGLSTFSEALKKRYTDTTNDDTAIVRSEKVEVVTLQQIFKEHAVNSIQFLKIDVEGLEYEVLKSNDWQQYRPEVLCIEVSNIIKRWEDIVVANGYSLVFFDGLNNYYVDQATDRAKRFDYIRDVVNAKGGGIRADDFEIIRSQFAELQKLKQTVADKTHHVQELSQQVATLHANNSEPAYVAKRLAVLYRDKLRGKRV